MGQIQSRVCILLIKSKLNVSKFNLKNLFSILSFSFCTIETPKSFEMEAKRIKLSGGENGDGGSNIPIRTLCVSRVNADVSYILI